MLFVLNKHEIAVVSRGNACGAADLNSFIANNTRPDCVSDLAQSPPHGTCFIRLRWEKKAIHRMLHDLSSRTRALKERERGTLRHQATNHVAWRREVKSRIHPARVFASGSGS